LSTKPETVLRNFSVPNRNLKWLNIQTYCRIILWSEKEASSQTCRSVWQRKWYHYARELGRQQMCGNMWLKGLRKHHESLHLTKPKAIAFAHAKV
jgi:hypothetical protein